MSKFIGNEQELLVSDLPIVRDVLRYGIFLREHSEYDRRNDQVDRLVGDIYIHCPDKSSQWREANTLFKPLITNEKKKKNHDIQDQEFFF